MDRVGDHDVRVGAVGVRGRAATTAPTKPSAQTKRRDAPAPRGTSTAASRQTRRRPRAAPARARARTSRRAACRIAGSRQRAAVSSASAVRAPAERVVGDRRRPDREREQERDERHDDARARPARRSSAASVTARPGRLVQHGRDQPQHVHRREHDRDRADDGPAPAVLEDAGQDQELAGERAEPGTASAITPTVISTVASAGRPRAIPPSRAKLAGRRRAARPRRRAGTAPPRSSPWLTICSTAPLRPGRSSRTGRA